MSRWPGIEAFILAALEEQGEVRPPEARLAQEWFWQAASALQARGLCVADQAVGVVRLAECWECGGVGTLASLDAEGMERGSFTCPTCKGRGRDVAVEMPTAEDLLRALVDALEPLEEDVSTYPSAWEIDLHGSLDGDEWAERVRTLRTEAESFLATSADGVVAERSRIRREMAAEIRLSFGAQIAARGGGTTTEALELAQLSVLAALDRIVPEEG